MIDLHAHILPGVDDGAQSMEMSLEMARMAVESGVEAMVVTPHCNHPGHRRKNYNSPDLRERIDRLRRALERERIPLRIFPGAEIFADDQVLELMDQGRLPTINVTPVMLVEFGFEEDGEFMLQTLEGMIERGCQPLVAHPERYRSVARDPYLAWIMADMGCALQLNRGSLLGRFGGTIRHTSVQLLEHELCACVASDCHRSNLRTPWMADVRDYLEENYGQRYAKLLLEDNPKRLLMGKRPTGLHPRGFYG